MAELKGNKYGTHRVIEPKGVLTQAAWKVDNDMSKVYSNEIVCDVTSLNIDSASFTQIAEACGGGKTPVMPNYLISETPRKVILRNFEGVITSYTQPEHYVQDCHCDVCMGKKKAEKTGVAWVAEGTKQRYLEPTKLLRNERHVKK